MWPWPRGKYQMSPGSKSFVSAYPPGPKTVVRTRPLSTNAHSAAVACQWSSRMPPGSIFMDTGRVRSEEHTSELQSRSDLVCRLLLHNHNLQQFAQRHS